MGRDKALIDWQGAPLVVQVARRLRDAVGDVVVVTKDPRSFEGLGLRVEQDLCKLQTPLAGILTALEFAAGRPAFILACDMPFVEPAFVRMLLEAAEDHDAAVPLRDGRLEPLHAVWRPSSLPEVADALDRAERAPLQVLGRLRVLEVPETVWRRWDPDGLSLMNVNTPEELERARGRSP